MKKIAIIGSGGSGKSTLAVELGDILGLPVFHLDNLYWSPGWVAPSKDQWLADQNRLCDLNEWIIDGNYQSTIDIRLQACDTVIFLDVNRYVCIYRALKRTFFRKDRPDIAEGCEERFDFKFLKFLWDYPIKARPMVLKKLQEVHRGKQVFIANSRAEVIELIQRSSSND